MVQLYFKILAQDIEQELLLTANLSNSLGES